MGQRVESVELLHKYKMPGRRLSQGARFTSKNYEMEASAVGIEIMGEDGKIHVVPWTNVKGCEIAATAKGSTKSSGGRKDG